MSFYTAFTGEQIPVPQFNEGVMYFIFQLHTEMFAGLPGKLSLGAMNMLGIVNAAWLLLGGLFIVILIACRRFA